MTLAPRRATTDVWCGLATLGIVAIICLWAFANAPVALNKGTFGPFERSLNTTEHGYAILRDITDIAQSGYLERFEVRNGECGKNGAWDECEQDRERSELSQTERTTGVGETHWYGFTLSLPSDFPDVWPTKTVFAQFHQTGENGTNGKPVWMLLHKNGALMLDDQTAGHSTRQIELIPPSALSVDWHRIEIKAHWAKDATGTFDVWINGTHVFAHKGPTMNAQNVYFRYGVYRSFVSRYKSAKNTDSVPTQIAYFGDVKRASTRAGLN